MAGVYSPEAKEELRASIKAKLIEEFGASQSPTTLDKYAHAMARALAEEFYRWGSFPDEDEYPAP